MIIDPFVVKRTMRANRQEATRQGVAAVLDVGTSKIACVALKFNFERNVRIVDTDPMAAPMARYEVIGFSHSKSDGMLYGEVSDKVLLKGALHRVLSNAQRLAQQRLDHIFVCFSGGRPQSFTKFGDVAIEESFVSELDISRALAACNVPDAGADREYLHAHPINFTVDHRPGLHDPRKVAGNRLAVDLHLVTVDSQVVADVISSIEDINLTVSGVASSAYASGLAALVAEEMEIGAACIDIGSSSTSIAVFFKKHMIHTSALRVGGDHITSDISQAFSIPWAEAEKLKISQGSVLRTRQDDRTMCEFRRELNLRDRISRSELIGVIKPRMEEILEEASRKLDQIGFSSIPGSKVVLTGGCVSMDDIHSLATEIFGSKMRAGQPAKLRGLPHSMSGPQFSAAVGMCLHAIQPQDEFWDFPLVQSVTGATTRMQRTFRWLSHHF